MNSLPEIIDTVTELIDNNNPRAESTPVARKRRMMDQQPSSSSSSSNNLLNKASKKYLASTISTLNEQELTNNNNNNDKIVVEKPPIHPDLPRKRIIELSKRGNDTMKLRKTIQWLENGAKKLREDLADVRKELHEEKRATRIFKKTLSTTIRDARNDEAIKYQSIITDLKMKLSNAIENVNVNNNGDANRADFIRDENHKREILAARKRLAEADEKIRQLKNHSIIDGGGGGNSMKRRKIDEPDYKKMDYEIRNLRQINKRLEDKLQIVTDAERARAVELRTEYEKHAAEMSALKKSLRSESIKMMDEIKNKEREIEKLEKIIKKMNLKYESMRKLRMDNEKDCQVTSNTIPCDNNNLQQQQNNVCELEELRKVAIEQQEIIEYLRQALKERERKLDQLTNKKRKEEFYKQWLELEPVAEVDDEDDSALSLSLSSGPSSLSPQPTPHNLVPRELYENLLIEYEHLENKYSNNQEELQYAKSQVRDLEKALLQETRGSLNNRRLLSEKLKETEERELNLLAEISDIREQNELLEFRILELEEIGGSSREIPDDTADSGIVSPDLIHNNNNNKQHRAIATVIPYNNNNNNNDNYKSLTINLKKSPLSLQESGIFEDEDDDDDDDEENQENELINCGIQTEAPSCELLQEVERLEQLRERIQERTVKVPAQIDNTCCEIIEGKMLFYKERIKELEDKVENYEIANAERIREQAIIKQREEDLLDENYRLTEKVCKLENEIDDLNLIKKNTRDFGTSTDNNDGDDGDDEIQVIDCLDCKNIKKDYNNLLEKCKETENLLKTIETAFENRLEHINAKWNEKVENIITESDCERINLMRKIHQLEERVFQPMDIDDDNFNTNKSSKFMQTDVIYDEDISRKQFDNDMMTSVTEVDNVHNLKKNFEKNKKKSSDGTKETIKQTAEKVIRKERKCRSEREGWAMKVSKSYQDKNNPYIVKRRSIIGKHHLILYPEISV